MKTFRFILLIIAICRLTGISHAQTICSYNCAVSMQDINNRCSSSLLARERYNAAGNGYAFMLFDSLLTYLPKDQGKKLIIDYSFRSCTNVCSAAATIDDKKLPVIYYNPTFFQRLSGADEDVKWMIYGIFAHEIGHELLKHPSENYDKISTMGIRRFEKEADFFSGYLLSKVPGCTLNRALLGLGSLNQATYKPVNDQQEKTANYPTLTHRREAVTAGFQASSNSPLTISVFNTIDSLHKFAVNPDHSFPILFRYMEKKLSLKDFKSAEDLLLSYEKNNPGATPDILSNLHGIVKAFQKDDNVAESHFDKALLLKPNNVEYLQNNIDVEKDEQKKAKDIQRLKVLKNKQNGIL